MMVHYGAPPDMRTGRDLAEVLRRVEEQEDALPRALPPTPVAPRTRANFIGAPAFFELNQACHIINNAYGWGTCYLVGSALVKRDHRDVDVRCMLSDAEFNRLFRADDGRYHNALWSLTCMTISLWLRERTGLNIDFQLQSQTRANAEHPGERQALGLFLDYPGDRPNEAP